MNERNYQECKYYCTISDKRLVNSTRSLEKFGIGGQRPAHGNRTAGKAEGQLNGRRDFRLALAGYTAWPALGDDERTFACSFLRNRRSHRRDLFVRRLQPQAVAWPCREKNLVLQQ
jgi:hypothetical protein